jgi:hypothetical protein
MRVVLGRLDDLWRTELGGEDFGGGLRSCNSLDVGVEVGLFAVFKVV